MLDGITQDFIEAAHWYGMAADQGFAEAQHRIGVMFEGGLGMRQDFVLAYAYISLAADQEFDLAVSSLQRLKNKMTPEQIT